MEQRSSDTSGFKEFFQAAVADPEATPGVIIAIRTFGELLNIHPHRHCLATDGGFDREGPRIQSGAGAWALGDSPAGPAPGSPFTSPKGGGLRLWFFDALAN